MWRYRKHIQHHRVPRKELWYCMRKSKVVDKYLRVIQDTYEDSEITSDIGSEPLLEKYLHISIYTRSKYKLEVFIKITTRW